MKCCFPRSSNRQKGLLVHIASIVFNRKCVVSALESSVVQGTDWSPVIPPHVRLCSLGDLRGKAPDRSAGEVQSWFEMNDLCQLRPNDSVFPFKRRARGMQLWCLIHHKCLQIPLEVVSKSPSWCSRAVLQPGMLEVIEQAPRDGGKGATDEACSVRRHGQSP